MAFIFIHIFFIKQKPSIHIYIPSILSIRYAVFHRAPSRMTLFPLICMCGGPLRAPLLRHLVPVINLITHIVSLVFWLTLAVGLSKSWVQTKTKEKLNAMNTLCVWIKPTNIYIKSPAILMIVQQLVAPNIKTSKLHITGPSWREYTGYPWNPITKASNTANVSMSLHCHDLNFPSPRCYSFGTNLMYDTPTPTCNPGLTIWPLRSGWPIISGHGI